MSWQASTNQGFQGQFSNAFPTQQPSYGQQQPLHDPLADTLTKLLRQQQNPQTAQYPQMGSSPMQIGVTPYQQSMMPTQQSMMPSQATYQTQTPSTYQAQTPTYQAQTSTYQAPTSTYQAPTSTYQAAQQPLFGMSMNDQQGAALQAVLQQAQALDQQQQQQQPYGQHMAGPTPAGPTSYGQRQTSTGRGGYTQPPPRGGRGGDHMPRGGDHMARGGGFAPSSYPQHEPPPRFQQPKTEPRPYQRGGGIPSRGGDSRGGASQGRGGPGGFRGGGDHHMARGGEHHAYRGGRGGADHRGGRTTHHEGRGGPQTHHDIKPMTGAGIPRQMMPPAARGGRGGYYPPREQSQQWEPRRREFGARPPPRGGPHERGGPPREGARGGPQSFRANTTPEKPHTQREVKAEPTTQEDNAIKYAFFGAQHNVGMQCIDYPETRRRYPRLHVVPEFALSVSSWQNSFPPMFSSHYAQSVFQSFPPGLRFPVSVPLLEAPVPIECDNEFRALEDEVEPPVATPVDGIVYQVKVLLCCGVFEGPQARHMSSDAMFMVIKKNKSDLALVGGLYDHVVDGGGAWAPPKRDRNGVLIPGPIDEHEDAGFIRCACRHARDLVDLDLTDACQWWRFMEIHYTNNVGERQITMVYLVSLWDLVPSLEDTISTWKDREIIKQTRLQEKEKRLQEMERIKTQVKKEEEQKEGEAVVDLTEDQKKEDNHEHEEAKTEDKEVMIDMNRAPKTPCLFASIKRVKYQQMKSFMISLNGLLEYRLEDDKQETFEVSLAAENFVDLLQRDMGMVVHETIANYILRKRAIAPGKHEEEEENVEAQQLEQPMEVQQPVVEEQQPVVEELQPGEEQQPVEQQEQALPATDSMQLEEQQPVEEEQEINLNEPAPVVAIQAIEVEEDQAPSEAPVDQPVDQPEVQELEAPDDDQQTDALLKRKREASPIFPCKRARGSVWHEDICEHQCLEAAFLFFDKHASGYLKDSDLETILNSVGQGISRLQFSAIVDDLWRNVDRRKLNYDIFFQNPK